MVTTVILITNVIHLCFLFFIIATRCPSAMKCREKWWRHRSASLTVAVISGLFYSGQAAALTHTAALSWSGYKAQRLTGCQLPCQQLMVSAAAAAAAEATAEAVLTVWHLSRQLHPAWCWAEDQTEALHSQAVTHAVKASFLALFCFF